jgi:hypothetical protein
MDSDGYPGVGEVVLHGTRIDEYSDYLGRPELCYKFEQYTTTGWRSEGWLTRTLYTCYPWTVH